MKNLRQSVIPLLCLVFSLLGCVSAQAQDKIKVGIITGQNNHGWMMDTPVLKNILDDAGLFETSLLISPDAKDPEKAQKWKTFKPNFAQYDVIVINYNGEMWPDNIKQEFEGYINGGGKAYAFHAGNNPFNGWTEFEKMIGLLWRGNKDGKRLYFDADGNEQFMQAGEGPGAGHGRQHDYLVDTRDNNHPIFKDLPDQWMHAKDELYHGQRGPAENMTVLLTAFSDKQTGGTGVSEAIVWTIPYGKGTVLTNVMGHWWKNDKDGPALKCAGFQTIFIRSIEWLATGKVTTPKPDDFPTKDAVSMRELKTFEPLAFIYVPGVPGSDPLASCGCGEHRPVLATATAWSRSADLIQSSAVHALAKR